MLLRKLRGRLDAMPIGFILAPCNRGFSSFVSISALSAALTSLKTISWAVVADNEPFVRTVR